MGNGNVHGLSGAEVKKIEGIKKNYNVLFQNMLTEGNVVADFLANLGFFFAGCTTFTSFESLPRAGKNLLNMDKARIPNTRIRIAKRKAPNL